MNRRYKIMAVVLVLLIAAMVVLQALKPQPLNWYPSYSKIDKIPLGAYVFYDQLENKSERTAIEEVTVPPFERLMDSLGDGTYFFLNDQVSFDKAERDKLLKWVGRGNTLFVSATYQSAMLLDTLGLEQKNFYDPKTLTRKPLLNLTNPSLKAKTPYLMNKDTGSSYFAEIDTAKTTVLGVYDIMQDKDSTKIKEPKVNFVKVPFEKGTVYLHLFPQAFSNFFLLQGNHAKYADNVLAYLPQDGKLYVDQYYKSGVAINTSPLFLIFNNRYLKWAYYTVLIIALLWVIFEGKRKQRSVPVVKPMPNQSLDFTRTIAGMYLEKNENRQIALHQINYFLEYLRSKYRIATEPLSGEVVSTIAQKSGVDFARTKELMDYIVWVRQSPNVNENGLIKLNTMIEKFKAQH